MATKTKTKTNKICLRDGCNKQARRKFCSNKCKDKYHNTNNPRGIFAYLNPTLPEYDPDRIYNDSVHPCSSEGLGQ